MRDSKASMYNPNNSGLNGQPCFTSIVHGNVLERPSVGCDTHAWSWLYMDHMHPSTSLTGVGTTRLGGEEGNPSSTAKRCQSASLLMMCAASFYARYRL
ncbi:unnamed protein product [Sphagnum troendelagicum]|uniref:Uncharacterized protein n=1 Tax=Sphagnum troendelagicum TaxID=128251 RepID=A0ABP0UK82_9BRYO